MKSIQQAMLEEIYLQALAISRKQTVGEKHDYYITIEQLENILKVFQS